MNQQRLKAYLGLIQELLTCPKGEEWIHLRQHKDLFNPDLVQVMEQAATQLAAEGNADAARFLHNWAAKLHHILLQAARPQHPTDDQADAYLELIQALLDCPTGRENELLAANTNLIGPGLVRAMQQVATEMKAQGHADTSTYLMTLAAELNQAWLQTHGFSPTFAKTAELDHKAALAQANGGEAQEPLAASDPVQAASIAPFQESATLNHGLAVPIGEQLAAIAQALAQISDRLPPPNPLWYMDVLERAQAANWVLTTTEIEQLIGVKPHYEAGETTFQRGCWVFAKTGKIGAQTAWQVSKQAIPN